MEQHGYKKEEIKMALTKTVELSNCISVENSYLRIDTYSGNKGTLSIALNYYSSKDVSDAKGEYIVRKLYDLPLSTDDNSSNPIKQGYEYLKTLTEFSGATDC